MPATPLPTRLVGVPADGAPEKQPVNSYDIVRGGWGVWLWAVLGRLRWLVPQARSRQQLYAERTIL